MHHDLPSTGLDTLIITTHAQSSFHCLHGVGEGNTLINSYRLGTSLIKKSCTPYTVSALVSVYYNAAELTYLNACTCIVYRMTKTTEWLNAILESGL